MVSNMTEARRESDFSSGGESESFEHVGKEISSRVLTNTYDETEAVTAGNPRGEGAKPAKALAVRVAYPWASPSPTMTTLKRAHVSANEAPVNSTWVKARNRGAGLNVPVTITAMSIDHRKTDKPTSKPRVLEIESTCKSGLFGGETKC